MITQDQINTMNGPALVAWYNEHAPTHGKKEVKKFRDLTTARDTVYHFAYTYGLLNQPAADPAQVEATSTVTTPPTLQEGPISNAGVLPLVDAPADTQEETAGGTEAPASASSDPAATPLAQRLKLREGTNKAKVATVLIENLGSQVANTLLARTAYPEMAERDGVDRLKMVVKGVKVALDKHANEYELRSAKGSVGLFPREL